MGVFSSLKIFPAKKGTQPELIDTLHDSIHENNLQTSTSKKGEVVVAEEQLSAPTSNTPYIDLDLNLSPEEIHYRETSKWYKVKRFLWDGADKHPLEKKYLRKLDFFLLTSSCLGYFIKNLNQSNITLAYVNGMNEYYEMKSNQYNYMNTLFTILLGWLAGALGPFDASNDYMWQRQHPSVYALQFFIGLLESGYFPGLEWLLGSNYSTAELSKRSAYFAVSANISGIVSGPLQQAIIKRFGHSSMPPFKWMFVFDAVISFPIGLYTTCADPNTPSTTDAWYFTEQDKLVGLERRRRIGAELNTRTPYTWKKVKTFFNTWHIWVFPLLFLAYNNSCSAIAQPTFQTWMKVTLKKPSEVYNNYPSIISACGTVVTVVFAYTNDYLGGKKNFFFVSLYFICLIIGCALLAHWKLPIGLHWFCYFLIGIPISWGQPFIYSWVNRLLFGNDMKRNFVVVVTNTLAYVTGAWVPILVWDTKYLPKYHTGFTYTACLASFGLVMTVLANYLTKRDEKRKDAVDDELVLQKTVSNLS